MFGKNGHSNGALHCSLLADLIALFHKVSLRVLHDKIFTLGQ